MTNHKNRRAVYRVQNINGQFDHVATKTAAIARAREMVSAEPDTDLQTLETHWGVKIERVSAAVARSVGL